jgi:hypothetical protein
MKGNIMYMLTVVEENENANYIPSTNKEFTFIEVDGIPISSIEEALNVTKKPKKCSILKIEKNKQRENSIKLYEFISPENVFDAIQKPNFLISMQLIPMQLIQYLITNWQEYHKNDESIMFYVNRIKSLLKELL